MADKWAEIDKKLSSIDPFGTLSSLYPGSIVKLFLIIFTDITSYFDALRTNAGDNMKDFLLWQVEQIEATIAAIKPPTAPEIVSTLKRRISLTIPPSANSAAYCGLNMHPISRSPTAKS